MLYTRKGDGGTSGLFGTKQRLPKDSPVYQALGALDELNSLLGVCRAKARGVQHHEGVDIPKEVERVQQILFIAQAELAGAEKNVTQKHVDELEASIAAIEALIQNPHSFVIPGATELSALFDVARAVSRRAERTVVSAKEHRPVSATTGAYLNRMSSFLYALARYTAGTGTELSPTYE
jgi:cob(I)alamin adenosyltransferase